MKRLFIESCLIALKKPSMALTQEFSCMSCIVPDIQQF